MGQLFGLVLLFSAAWRGGDPSPAALSAADEAFARIDYPAAVASYETLLAETPDNPQILWRLARVYVCMGEPLEDGRRIDYVTKAENFARRCIAIDSTLAEGHTWLAGALGYVALEAGMKKQVELSQEILDETAAAIRLNPNDDAAYSIRGSLYRAIGNAGWVKRRLASLFVGTIPDGGFEEAEESLKHAIALNPDIMRHHYELGILYMDMGRNDDARIALERAAALPVRVAIDVPRREKARSFLRSLQSH